MMKNKTKTEKPKAAKDKSANDWLQVMLQEKIISGTPEVAPEGWMTAKQMCEQSNLSDAAMRNRIKVFLKQGRLIEKTYRIWTGHQIAATKHYFPKK